MAEDQAGFESSANKAQTAPNMKQHLAAGSSLPSLGQKELFELGLAEGR
jgi:hypothetical protein